ERIKFCIDTCHIFSAGYEIGCESFVDIFDNILESYLGWENIACIHLNDSLYQVNCKKDRHADISKGRININGLKKFVNLSVLKKIPIVLETPCDIISK